MKMRKISIILSLLLSAALAVAVYQIVQTAVTQQKEKDDFQVLIEQVEQTKPEKDTPKEQTETPKPEVKPTRNIKPALEQNRECIGWLCIEGTNVNYPVMHTPSNPEKYLRKNFGGEYSQSGVPFLDGRCSLKDGNLIIFGHNMKNGTMFSDLKKYLDTAFRNAHKLIEFETADGIFLFEVMDVIRTDIHNERYNKLNSEDGRCLVLSTCYGSAKSGRLLIIAKEVEP